MRVRIYELVADGQWDDRGTGLLYVREEERKIVILDELTQKEIMSHIVDNEIEYELQGTTIISWLEPETPYSDAMDLALSFQEDDACAATWEWMGRLPCWISGQTGVQNLDGALPPLEKDNLSLIRQHLSSPKIIDWSKVDKKGFGGWFGKLHDVLTGCEREGDNESCEKIHGLLHGLVKFANPEAMDAFSGHDVALISQLLHIAEYHPHRKSKQMPEISLRQRYKNSSKLNLPGVQLNEDINAAIQRLFILIFLRDVVLLSLFEDTSLAHFEHQIYHANLKVVSLVAEDRNFWINLQTKFKEFMEEEDKESYDKLCILVSFCHELIMKRCKILKLAQRRNVILTLVNHGLLKCLYSTGLAPHTTPRKHPLLWRLMIETIHQTYSGMGIAEMKNHVTSTEQVEKDQPTFLRKLLKSLHQPCEPGLQSQIIFLIRSILLFPDAQTPEAALFLNQAPTSNLSDIWRMFHDYHVENLIILLQRQPECALDDRQLQQTQIYVIDILKSMVDNHDFAMKRTVLKNGLMQKIASLITIPDKKQPLRSRKMHLCLSCMRFLRACIAKNESFYKKKIMKAHILDSSVNLFCYAPRSSNLLNSCFLSLLHPLISDQTRSQYPELLKYIVERYLPRLEAVDGKIFQIIRRKMKEDEEKAKAVVSSPPTTLPSEDDDKEEENLKSVPSETTSMTKTAEPKKPVFEKVRPNEFHDPSGFNNKPPRKKRKSESPLDFSKKQKISHCP